MVAVKNCETPLTRPCYESELSTSMLRQQRNVNTDRDKHQSTDHHDKQPPTTRQATTQTNKTLFSRASEGPYLSNVRRERHPWSGGPPKTPSATFEKQLFRSSAFRPGNTIKTPKISDLRPGNTIKQPKVRFLVRSRRFHCPNRNIRFDPKNQRFPVRRLL